MADILMLTGKWLLGGLLLTACTAGLKMSEQRRAGRAGALLECYDMVGVLAWPGLAWLVLVKGDLL